MRYESLYMHLYTSNINLHFMRKRYGHDEITYFRSVIKNKNSKIKHTKTNYSSKNITKKM